MLKRVLKLDVCTDGLRPKGTKIQVYHKTSLHVSQIPSTVQLKTKKWQIYMKSHVSERR